MGRSYNAKICLVGLGPAGIGAALVLKDRNIASGVICLDAGNRPNRRSCLVLNNERCKRKTPCDIISGFGGCSLLIGGKISTFPAGKKLARVLGSEDSAKIGLDRAFQLLSKYIHLEENTISADEIKKAERIFSKKGFDFRFYNAHLYDQEELKKEYERILLELESAGMSIFFNTELTKIRAVKKGFRLTAKNANGEINIFAKKIILGVGRLGKELLKDLNQEFQLSGKERFLDVGIRLEFPTSLLPRMANCHNDLKLLFGQARTFCFCRDGKIAQYFLDGLSLTEGISNPRSRSSLTNLGIFVRIKASRGDNSEFDQIRGEILHATHGEIIYQCLPEYLGISDEKSDQTNRNSSHSPSWKKGDVNLCFPRTISSRIKESTTYFVSRIFSKKNWDKICVFAPELDYGGLSFPIRPNFSIAPGLFLIGDCTGRFRGILQAFCSGIICAEKIVVENHEKNLSK